jgi:Tol biopolymer transport system component/tRNA A-37 threonylcarbamoyl transferase component Bud32
VIGETLSHYEITAALGAGGMGEVYRATDTNLSREVAIKVLPSEVAEDTERLARFKREAHLLAALNHPNIAAIYGLEEADGRPFLALELVEGEDLKERLGRGAIPVDEALEIAKQIAEALEEAHDKGIVHRDLKPANVKITPDGRVKVLDFGLAKAWAGEAPDRGSPSPALSRSPTLEHSGTQAGVILGTAAYMSPQQARGKPVDKRADVWSFGVLLWEMLTGRSLFTGDTVTDVIAAVVTKEPDLDALPATTPPAVRRLLGRCLRKDERTRLPDVGAARLELQDVLAGTSPEADASTTAGGEARAARRRLTRERWAWAVVALVLAGIAAFRILGGSTEAPEARPAAHFVLDTPADLAFDEFVPLAVSPDGRSIVFAGGPPAGTVQLWIFTLDAPEVRALPGTEGAGQPFWSPDSTSIAFFAESELRKVSLARQSVQRICTLPQVGFPLGTWSAEGTVVFTPGDSSARLYSVSAAGGEARPLTTHDESRGETDHWSPQFLPDGRLLFLIAGTKEENTGLHVVSLEAPDERRRILPDVRRFRYAPPGQLLFVKDGTLLAQRLDADDQVPLGEAVPIASDVGAWALSPGFGSFSVSATGLVAWTSAIESEVQLEWLDRKGTRLGMLGAPGSYGQIALSPDEGRVAVEIADAGGRVALWVVDVARGVASRVTTDTTDEANPVWSPEGRELVFEGGPGGGDLHRTELRAGATASSLLEAAGRQIPEDWSRDGKTLLYLVMGEETAVWALPLDDGGSPEVVLKSGLALDEPRLSPDGRWLAYISSESGQPEVYVEPFRRRGEKVRVSPDGGGQPRWRGDGKELFYLSPDGRLMVVDVREGARGPEVGLAMVLIPAEDLRAVVQGPDFDDYAVTADGQRFLVKRPGEEGARQRIHVLLDWRSLLE